MKDGDYCNHNYQQVQAEESDFFRDFPVLSPIGEFKGIPEERSLEYECTKCGDRLGVRFK
ncbi:MAG: hypothetical protein M1165_00235 [Candidatus Pacearchaeota archaeon]|nr:hypothetical protein [Candidatus Pacearchaeota archaeon]MDE1848685.1 hypothetical protein [Nanoarchaeota archaeon]